MKLSSLSTAFLLIFCANIHSYAAETKEEEITAKCENWTLSTTFDWAGCKWNADGGWADQAKESLLDSLKKSAKEKIKAVALDYLASLFPGGSFVAGFAGGQGGPSELQLAVEQILNAIKVSQEKIIGEMNKILIVRDFANLDAFKLRVRSYMLYSDTVKKNNLNELQNLWNTSVDLRNLFETHTNLLGAGETVDSLQAYMSIVSLELMLRAQLTVYNYSISNEPEKINQALINHFQEELAEVFLHMNSIDWVKGAEAFQKNKKETIWNVGNKLGGCAVGRLIEFDYLDEHFTARSVCSIKTGNCETDFPQGNFRNYGFNASKYSYTSSYKASNCVPKNNTQMPLNDASYQYSAQKIVRAISEQIARKFIGDVYKSSYTILDQWWEMAKFGGMRPRNYADQVLIQYYADKMFISSGIYTLKDAENGGLLYTDRSNLLIAPSGTSLYAQLESNSVYAQWSVDRQGEFFTIRSKYDPTKYIQIKNEQLILSIVPNDLEYAQWKLVEVDGKIKIRNRKLYDRSLNDINGVAQVKQTIVHSVEATGWLFSQLAPLSPQTAVYGPTGCPSGANCPAYYVSWSAVTGATHYNWKTTPVAAITKTTATSSSSYVLPSGGSVQACNQAGCSDWIQFKYYNM